MTGMRLLHRDPVHHRAEIIAEVERVGRLHAGEDAFGKFAHGVESRLEGKFAPG